MTQTSAHILFVLLGSGLLLNCGDNDENPYCEPGTAAQGSLAAAIVGDWSETIGPLIDYDSASIASFESDGTYFTVGVTVCEEDGPNKHQWGTWSVSDDVLHVRYDNSVHYRPRAWTLVEHGAEGLAFESADDYNGTLTLNALDCRTNCREFHSR